MNTAPPDGSAPRQAEGTDAPLILRMSNYNKFAGIGLGVHLTFCALISAAVSRHVTGHYLNDFGVLFVIMALCCFFRGNGQRLNIDAAGVRYLGSLLPCRACWTDVTAISEHYSNGRYSGWSVRISKKKGSLLILDVFSLERTKLIAVMTQRWQAALPDAAGRALAHAR